VGGVAAPPHRRGQPIGETKGVAGGLSGRGEVVEDSGRVHLVEPRQPRHAALGGTQRELKFDFRGFRVAPVYARGRAPLYAVPRHPGEARESLARTIVLHEPRDLVRGAAEQAW
jgi:hypothetical protein